MKDAKDFEEHSEYFHDYSYSIKEGLERISVNYFEYPTSRDLIR